MKSSLREYVAGKYKKNEASEVGYFSGLSLWVDLREKGREVVKKR